MKKSYYSSYEAYFLDSKCRNCGKKIIPSWTYCSYKCSLDSLKKRLKRKKLDSNIK